MEEDNKQQAADAPKKKSLGRKILRGFLRLCLLVVFLLFLLTMLLQTNWFQNKAITYLTEQLSSDLETKVELKHIDFEIFDKLVLDSFYVEDRSGDTLLFSEQLVVNFNSSLLALFQSKLAVKDLTLRNAKLKLRRLSGEKESNLNQLLLKLFPPKPDDGKPKKPFYLDADAVNLKNLTFENYDEVKGERIKVFVDEGAILVENIIAIESIRFGQTYVQVDLRDRQPLPVDTTLLVEAISEPQIEIPDSLRKPLQLSVHRFDFENGKLSLHNYRKAPVKTKPDDVVDVNHLEAFDINIAIDSMKLDDGTITGSLKKLATQDSSGFILENLSASTFKVEGRRTELNDVSLRTPFSNVQDTIIFKYRDFGSFNNFEDEVNMDLSFVKSKIALRDVMAFIPKLKRNKFMIENQNEVLQLDGRVKGRVNNLRAKDLKITLGKNTFIEGDFSSRNLAVKGNESLNLNLKRMKTNVAKLRQLIPNFNPPSNFDRLGNISFNGRFDGFFVDFVAYGDLQTDLGSARMDMRLDLKEGKEGANYSGNLNLLDFDLATWSGDSQLGKITVTSKIYDGVGLTANTAKAKVDANVDQFTFRDYTYQDFKMDGELTQNLFDGDFIIKDKNIDLTFAGSVDFRDSVPVFDFKAKVNTLNLDELNLAKQDLGISGEMDLNIRDVNISNLTGNAKFRNLAFQRNGNEYYQIDTLAFYSIFGTDGQRIFSAKSEILEGEITGNYDIQEVPDAFVLFVERNYPEIAERFNVKSKRQELKSTDFKFKLNIIDSKNFTYLLDTKLDTIKNLLVKGNYDGINSKVNLELDLEQLNYGNIEVGDLKFNGSAFQSQGRLSSLLPFYAIINGKNYIPEINVDTKLNRDTVSFMLGGSGEKKSYDQFNLGGQLTFQDGGVDISLASDSLVLFGEEWEISKNNFLYVGKRLLDTEDFVLTNGQRKVSIKDINRKGLHLSLENFNTGFIDSVWSYRQLDFAGRYSVDVKAQDIFELRDFEAVVASDSFLVNEEDWGALELKVNLADLKSQVLANLTIQRGLRELVIDGFYVINPTTEGRVRAGKKENRIGYAANYFEFKLDMLNYPLDIARFFIGQHTSNIEGLVDIDATLKGFPKQIETAGDAKIYKGAITVDYLNTRYLFGQENPTNVKITNDFFDFSNNAFTDKYGNEAEVTGGIFHTNFKNAGLNAQIVSNRLLALDTDKFDNPLYYGHGIGQVDARFVGPFPRTDVTVYATTGKGTKMFIPITEGGEVTTETNFIRFRNKNEVVEKTSVAKEIKGMDIDMNVTMTEDAEVSLIFDERAGDIIRGTGNGALQLKVPRGGEMALYGEYIVAEGDYLFTLKNIINKKFKVERGGTINWTGDPLAATINLDAYYDRLTTPVYNFIQEFVALEDDDLKRQARKPTAVDLQMNLRGDLMQPEINFDFSFPNLLTGPIKSYVDTKLQAIRDDQSEMNRQVFGLIVIGGFLPSGQESLAGGELTTSGINTVSEYLSNRLSIYMTQLLSEAFSDVGFVSGVDFDIAYNIYDENNISLQSPGAIVTSGGSEMQVNFNPRFWNDRISVNGGIVRSTNTNSGGTFIGSDFVFEYFLTEDRRFKVRIYQRTEQDLAGDRRDRMGIGLTYRRQFDTLGEFFSGMKKAAKETAGN